MTIIFIDNQRKYKFFIGYKIKVGSAFYEIIGIEELRHKEATGSLGAGSTTTKDFNNYMQPLDNMIYFVEEVGIDGNLGFQFEFPKGQSHHTPRGAAEYIYWEEANPLDPMYCPFVITPPNHPSFKLYNPTGAANNSDAFFRGEKWQVEKLVGARIPAAGTYTELMDYANPKGIGQG